MVDNPLPQRNSNSDKESQILTELKAGSGPDLVSVVEGVVGGVGVGEPGQVAGQVEIIVELASPASS